MANTIPLILERGFNIQDVKDKIRYFLGDTLLNKINPIQKDRYCLIYVPDGCENRVNEVVRELPCRIPNYMPKCLKQYI